MDQNILIKAKELIELNNGNICNNCLGRKFSNVIDSSQADGNEERGALIRKELSLQASGADEKETKCETCEDIILKINENIKNGNILERIKGKIDYLNLEFDTFIIG